MKHEVLHAEIFEFDMRVKDLFDKDPNRKTPLELIILYNSYVKRIQEIVPEDENAKTLKELKEEFGVVFNTAFYFLVGKLKTIADHLLS